MYFSLFRRCCHVAYRPVVWCCWGYLGRHSRIPLPSCVMQRVHTNKSRGSIQRIHATRRLFKSKYSTLYMKRSVLTRTQFQYDTLVNNFALIQFIVNIAIVECSWTYHNNQIICNGQIKAVSSHVKDLYRWSLQISPPDPKYITPSGTEKFLGLWGLIQNLSCKLLIFTVWPLMITWRWFPVVIYWLSKYYLQCIYFYFSVMGYDSIVSSSAWYPMIKTKMYMPRSHWYTAYNHQK